ncbi:MAG: putative addiction module antidote protein [Magnetococcales bacterium]|nr:putative addiction module antidote protein [Magnetococcales bacterium]
MPLTRDYQESLIESLSDPLEAAEYLNAALEEGDRELFLLCLKNVVQAQGGMSKLAKESTLNRESLYKMLSKKGNPKVSSLDSLLHAMNMRLVVQPIETAL